MEWQPIETAPKDGTWFLAGGRFGGCLWHCVTCSYMRIGGFCYLMLGQGGGWFSFSDEDQMHPPTHWMPLPPPPKD